MAVQMPPQAAGITWRLSPAAIWRNEVALAACSPAPTVAQAGAENLQQSLQASSGS